MTTKKNSTVQEANPEFLYVPIGNIVVLEQVRSNINIEADLFKSLVQSIKDKGILNSVIRNGEKGFKGSRVSLVN
jgi:hypothetical protein